MDGLTGGAGQMRGGFADDFDAPDNSILPQHVSSEIGLGRIRDVSADEASSLQNVTQPPECRAAGRVGQLPYKHTAVDRICSRAKRFDDFSSAGRRTKSTGLPTSSSASPAISSMSDVETGAFSSRVTKRSTSLPAAASPCAAEPKISSRRIWCFTQNDRSRPRSSARDNAPSTLLTPGR